MKVADHVLPKGTPTELIDFLDNIRAILNNGRYQLRVIETEPTHTTDRGEMLIQFVAATSSASEIKRLWFFAGDVWNKLEFSGTEIDIVTAETGEGRVWFGDEDDVPDGWFIANGAAISRTTYAALFAIIGTTYGAGDGSTTFNLPDCRGRVLMGLDNMGGTSANRVVNASADTLGGADGAETHTLAISEIPAHTHSVCVICAGSGASGGGNFHDSSGNSGSTGGGGSHNNMQPWLGINWMIKA